MNTIEKDGTTRDGAAQAFRNDVALEREALAWMDKPFEHFGHSPTKIHSVDRDHAEAVQLAAFNIRLEQRREQIATLKKLADSQGITQVDSFEAGAPLLFKHDVYKSYPVSLLAKRRFDQLMTWLSRLTPHDLSGVDVSKCETIDEWLVTLQNETALDVATSSGTSGTMSFFPRAKRDYTHNLMGLRVNLLTRFGDEPTDSAINDKFHVITPSFRDGHAASGRTPQYIKKVFAKDDEAYFHPCFDAKIDTDLLWLAGRLKAAAARGDVSKVDVPPHLLARRKEMEVQQRDQSGQQVEFIERMLRELAGQRVMMFGMTVTYYAVAKRGLEEGKRANLGPGSFIAGGGGLKGANVSDNVEQMICDYFGVDRMWESYGMTEVNSLSVLCEADKYHFPPWLTPYLLDIDSGKPLPRSGRQTGRAAFWDPTHDGSWGGLISGDMTTIEWDQPCTCGRKTVWMEKAVQRVSEAKGGDDKISCSAQPAALADAMDFLTALDS